MVSRGQTLRAQQEMSDKGEEERKKGLATPNRML